MMNKILITILAAAMIFSFGVKASVSQVTDIDGNTYKTVTIDSQVWTSENLNVSRYRNGDTIPQVQDSIEWANLKTGAWCYYNNDSANGKIYGKLYNWYAVNDSRGLAPEGWHIPTDAEWTTLTDFLGGITKEHKLGDGTKYWYIENVGGKLKATTLWDTPNKGATNSSSFTAFPGGSLDHADGSYYDVGEYGFFWSASAYDDNGAWARVLNYDDSAVNRNLYYKGAGFSVRCVRN